MSDAYIGLINLASAKNFLYDKNGMQRQQTVTRISLNISQGQKRDLFWNWCYCTFWVSGEATGVLSLVVSNCFWVESLVSDCMNLKLNTLYHFWDTDLGSKSARLTWAQPYKKIKINHNGVFMKICLFFKKWFNEWYLQGILDKVNSKFGLAVSC